MEMPHGEIPAEQELVEIDESQSNAAADQRLPLDQETPEESKAAVVITIQSWATPIAAALMLVVGLLAGYFGRPLLDARLSASEVSSIPASQAESSGSAPASASQDALMAAVVAQTRHFKGVEDAPVTIIEFSDFQCPYCQRFATGAGRQIDELYIQTGVVRFGYQHFAFLGPESQWAAEATECAAEQDAFWEYHDKLFDSQTGENAGAFERENLKRYAQEVGLDAGAFDECMDSGRHVATVQNETQGVQTLGVRSTPSFLINGQPVIGAQSFEVFQQYIEAEKGN